MIIGVKKRIDFDFAFAPKNRIVYLRFLFWSVLIFLKIGSISMNKTERTLELGEYKLVLDKSVKGRIALGCAFWPALKMLNIQILFWSIMIFKKETRI